ncbi:DNA-binding transcriptional MerR regulator [Crossiella equi]|uniref:DNA-binding transcriptional MerR regulator n=1 Tax=Crossiella equi TaxID=130796 RepID=A0ABS5AQ14_9PSEU|nr:DNA-binding transcriptional MerR regulator [Crossiella equi]
MNNLDNLDDRDYPAFTTGQAANLLGVQQAFLRSLDTANLVRPQRSEGGHRRYSRRQLQLAARIRLLFDEGHSLAATARIIGLEDDLAAAHDQIAALRGQLGNAPER